MLSLLVLLVLHLKKLLITTVLDSELRQRQHRARPNHIAVHCDVVAEDLGDDPPVLQPHV